MATGVAERAIAPGGSSVSPPAVRVRAAGVAWGWRVFLAVVFLVLFGPLLILMLFSVNDSNILAFPLEGVTFHWYGDAFRDVLLREALVNSIVVASIVAPVCLVLGTLTAFGLTRFRFRGRSAVGGLVGAPLDPAVADHRDRGADVLRAFQRRPVAQHGDRDADRVHVPAGDGDRRRAAVPVPARAGGGGDRPWLLADAGAALHHPAAHRSRAGGRARSSRSPGRSTTTRSARSRSGSSRRSRSGCTPTCATPITPRSSTRSRR